MTKKILVADDDKRWRDYHSMALGKMGYQVLVVENSDAASAALRGDPDIHGAVFDNDMEPGKGGIELLADMRFKDTYGERRKRMPVLMVFRDVPESVARSIKRWGGEYLDKNTLDDAVYSETVRSLFGGPVEVGVVGGLN